MGIKEKEKEAMVEAGRELTRKPMFELQSAGMKPELTLWPCLYEEMLCQVEGLVSYPS